MGFPMVSRAIWLDKIPIVKYAFNLYNFVAYNVKVNTSVSYLGFYRTIKTVEYRLEESDVSVVFYYSSSMNNYYNSMIRDLSISYNKMHFDTHLYLGMHFYLN